MYQRPTDLPNALRLHLNENTAGCSPAVLAAIHAVTREEAAFYPDYGPVTEAAGRFLGVPAEWVQLTNGLDEGLHLVAQAGALRAWAARYPGGLTPAPPSAHETDGGAGFGPPDHVLFPEPAFEMYAACAEASGLDVTRVQPEPDFRFPLEAILERINPGTRVVYLTDPNNPTGLAIPAGAIERIAAAAPDALVLVDEAYADFSGRTAIGPMLDRHRNLLVGRTFAKAHGLAALRAGALIAHPDTLAPLGRIQPPFSLNICAVRALEAALADRPYLEWYVAQSVESRRMVYDLCGRYGLTFWPSEANFVLVRLGDGASDIVRALSERGILIRDRTGAPGCAGCVRITTGVAADTRRAVDALEEILATRAR